MGKDKSENSYPDLIKIEVMDGIKLVAVITLTTSQEKRTPSPRRTAEIG